MKPNKSYGNSNYFDKLFMRWVNELISIAQTKSIETTDFKQFGIDSNSEELFKRFSNVFENITISKYALAKTLFLTLKVDVIAFSFWQFVMAISQFCIPIIIKEIIEVTQNQQTTLLYYYLCVLLLIRFISNISINMSKFLNITVGNDAYSIVAMAIMDKSLKVSFLSNLTHTSGQVINLLQVDALKLQMILQWIGLLILCPIQILIAVALLFYFIGFQFTGGLVIIILFVVINGYLGKICPNKRNDERMNAEILAFQQIKFVKINAYEQWFEEKLEKLRYIECEALRYRFIVSALCIFTSWLGPILIFIITFSSMYFSGNQITTQKIFLLLNFISMLQPQIIMFPQAISQILQILQNMKRIQEFLFAKEMMTGCMINQQDAQPAIMSIKDGDFYWPKNQLQVKSDQPEIQAYSIKLTLKDINIQLNHSQLIAIIGDIGSGKSSLIYSILGEMLYDENVAKPKITRNGRLAYVGQKPWVMNASVRDNILFGLEFDQKRYQEALRYSQLETDLQILKKGDLTMIGEKGVNISGGQKTRIAIARAIYNNADIIIMDDPLSAVDAYVGNYLMNECFSKYLAGKLRVLITHNLSLLGLADQIIVMSGGVIEFQGKFEELRQSQYYTAASNYHHSIPNELQIEYSHKSTQVNDEKSADSLMISQSRQRSDISWETLKDYFNYTNGYTYAITILIIQISWIASYVLSIVELSEWSKSQSLDDGYYLKRYTFFSILQVIFVFLRPLSVLQNSVDTSKRLHNKMIKCLFKADLCNFFERVPVGRILNVLSKDLNVLDQEMYFSLCWFLAQANLLISTLIIYIYSTTPFVILPILFYILVCNYIKNYYMKASTEIKRLESCTKGPMLSYFSECLTNGLISIRAYNKQADTLQQHSLNLDQNRQAFIILNAVNAWFLARLGVASLILNIVVIMYCVAFLQISPASIAMILSFATALDINISSGFQAFSQYQLNFVAFENCRFMTMIESEEKSDNSVEMQAQFNGMVEFKDFTVKYRPNLPPALKNISLIIQPNEKIGVVGRTGAGKSTITLSLLRIINGLSGNLYIDGKDIKSISLKYLRQNITMIMQEPNLFTGTIKQNLDPFQLYDDQTIMEAINKCCLSDLIHKRDGLESHLLDGGKNLSEGERQLLCIARAVLKKSKIILIDEATANIDLETDTKIQETIQNVFRDCTVITIAHRVSTILYCDKILMIENGEVAEFDETNVLLQNSNSKFARLHNQTKNQ